MLYEYPYNTNESWKRLEAVIKRTGLNINAFSRTIYLPSDGIYLIKFGKYPIIRDLAKRIVRYYPEINEHWLLTGEGEMLNEGYEDDKTPKAEH